MRKVVTERPRRNPWHNKQARRASLPDELLPKFEGIRRAHQSWKWSRYLLGPLRRWLQSNVGRPWNDVYSEACQVIKPDSVIGAHVMTHLLRFVERNAFMHEGRICVHSTLLRGPVPLTKSRSRRDLFYVHPETGLLERLPQVSQRELLARQPRPPATVHWLSNRICLQRIRGLWYECVFEKIPPRVCWKLYDHALECELLPEEICKRRRKAIICVHKRQLSSVELRKRELANLPGSPFAGAQVSVGFITGRLKLELILSGPQIVGYLEPGSDGSIPSTGAIRGCVTAAHREYPWSTLARFFSWPRAGRFQMGRSCGLSPVIGSTPICSTERGSSSVVEQPPQGVTPRHPLSI